MSSSNGPDGARRRFLGALTGSAWAFALLKAGVAHPQTAAKPVSAADPLAKALGYSDDASKVDKAKYPTFKAGEKCSTCRFYQGTAGQKDGPCQIFSGMLVSSSGWCSSYNAKT
jgi:hypothetical protein